MLAAAALAAPSGRREILFRGRVLDPKGRPLAGARVFTTGAREASVLSSSNGQYSLIVPLGTTGEIRRAPLRLRVEARVGGRRVPLAGGSGQLDIRLGAARAGEGLEIETSPPRVAKLLEPMLAAEGDVSAYVELDFGGAKSTGASASPPARAPSSDSIATRGTPPAAPPPAGPPHSGPDRSAPPAPTTPPVPDTSAASSRSPAPPTLPPAVPEAAAPAPAAPTPAPVSVPKRAPPPTPAAGGVNARSPGPGGLKRVEPFAVNPAGLSPADSVGETIADSCACRIKGTIELQFDRLLTARLRVVLSVRGMPSLRDTVELFMGSPRAFKLERVPCGNRSIEIRSLSQRRFVVISRETAESIDCLRDALRQPRIVIAPE